MCLLPGRAQGLWLAPLPFHASVRGSFSCLGGFEETSMFLPHLLVKLGIVGSLCDREVVCLVSDLQGLNFESCVWRAVSSHSSHHPQEVPGQSAKNVSI